MVQRICPFCPTGGKPWVFNTALLTAVNVRFMSPESWEFYMASLLSRLTGRKDSRLFWLGCAAQKKAERR